MKGGIITSTLFSVFASVTSWPLYVHVRPFNVGDEFVEVICLRSGLFKWTFSSSASTGLGVSSSECCLVLDSFLGPIPPCRFLNRGLPKRIYKAISVYYLNLVLKIKKAIIQSYLLMNSWIIEFPNWSFKKHDSKKWIIFVKIKKATFVFLFIFSIRAIDFFIKILILST